MSASSSAPRGSWRFGLGPPASLLYPLMALLLVIGGLGLRRIALINTDLESLTQLAEDVRTVYAPTPIQSGNEGAWWANHASGLRAWKLGWLALNGQLDSRVLHLGSLALHLAAMGALFFAVATTLPRRWAAPLAVGIVLLFETPAVAGLSPSADSVWGSSLLTLSLLHPVLMSRSPANSWRWSAGLLCGVLNVLGNSAGLTSAIALLIWSVRPKTSDAAAIHQRKAALSRKYAVEGDFASACERRIGLWVGRDRAHRTPACSRSQARPAVPPTS